jgi:hypothetical protein
MTVVKLVGGSIRIPGLAENENVIAKSEGVREDSNRAEVDIGVVTGGLAGGRTVKVPFRELIDRFNRLGESLDGRIFGLANMNLKIALRCFACHVSREGADMKSWLAVSSHRAQGLSGEGMG